MPATRSSGPPTAASLQPFLMEAFESFKQKHSKQNQDLIHKNRLLLKSTAELERVIKELKTENIELRIQVQKSNSLAQSWRQKAESASNQSSFSSQQADQIRLAVLDIANRCKTLESSLAHPIPSSSSSNPHPTPILASIPPAPSTSNCLPSLLPVRNRAELIALRERRRSQLAVEPEESRLSFINECSGNEDRSEATLPFELSETIPLTPNLPPKASTSNSTNQASRLLSGSSNHLLISSAHQNVAPRSKLRQELMAPFPKSPESRQNSKAPDNVIVNDELETNGPQTSSLHGADEGEKSQYERQSHKDNSCGDGDASLVDELNTGSFSAPNRAMSQFNQSPSSDSSDSDDGFDQSEIISTKTVLNTETAQQQEQRTSILTQRRSKKQRRTSLTPQHILETVSPAAFSLDRSTLPSERLSTEHDFKSTKEANISENHLSALDPILSLQPSSSKRRDSGLTKIEPEKQDGEVVEQISTLDEGWEKRPIGKKKRPRAELDAVSEEHPSHEETSAGDQANLPSNLSGAGPREARRARKDVNYALPSLNKKMRRPASQGSSARNRRTSLNSNKNISNSHTNPLALSNKLQSNSNCRSSGATPSAVQSNTSCSSGTNDTTVTIGSSPLSSLTSPLSSAPSSSSRLASVFIPTNQSLATNQEGNVVEPAQQQQSDHDPKAVKEPYNDTRKTIAVENRKAKESSSSKSKKEKKILLLGVTAQPEGTLADVPTHPRGMKAVTLEHLAQRAEQRNKENSGPSNRKKNLSSSTSSTTKKKNQEDGNHDASSSIPTTSKVNLLHDDNDDDINDVPIHLRGLRKMTREIAAGIDLEKLTTSLTDEGREFLFNPSRRRTQSMNSNKRQ